MKTAFFQTLLAHDIDPVRYLVTCLAQETLPCNIGKHFHLYDWQELLAIHPPVRAYSRDYEKESYVRNVLFRTSVGLGLRNIFLQRYRYKGGNAASTAVQVVIDLLYRNPDLQLHATLYAAKYGASPP